MQDNSGPQSDCSCPDEEVDSCHRCSLVAGSSATIVAWWQQQCYDRQEPLPTFNIPLPCLWLHMPLSGLQTIYVSNVVNPHYLELVIFWRTFWCQIRGNCRNSRSSVLFRFVSQRWGDSETSSKCFLLLVQVQHQHQQQQQQMQFILSSLPCSSLKLKCTIQIPSWHRKI